MQIVHSNTKARRYDIVQRVRRLFHQFMGRAMRRVRFSLHYEVEATENRCCVERYCPREERNPEGVR